MANAPDQQIRQQLSRFLNGDLSLADLEGWLVPLTWDLEPDAEGFDLAAEVKHRIAEYTSGDWTDDELREHLTALVPFSTNDWRTATTEATNDGPTDQPFSVAGTKFGAGVAYLTAVQIKDNPGPAPS